MPLAYLGDVLNEVGRERNALGIEQLCRMIFDGGELSRKVCDIFRKLLWSGETARRWCTSKT